MAYNKKILSDVLKNLKKVNTPAKPKDIIIDPMGQWKFPGQPTRIPGSDITMQGVPYPVLGVGSTGQKQMMYPNQEYQFPGAEYVDEFPPDKDAMNAMMKARLAYANEFGNPAAQRMITLPDNLYDFGDGNMGSHYMASMDNYAVPQIQDVNGKLVLGDFGPESNEAIRFDRPEDAEYFAEHYKDVSPAFIEAELTDKEIEEYKKGGYIIEEIAEDPPVYPPYYNKALSKRINLRELRSMYENGQLVPNPEWQNYLKNNLDPDLLNRWEAEQTTPEENDLVQMVLQERQKLNKYLDKEHKAYAKYVYELLKSKYKKVNQRGFVAEELPKARWGWRTKERRQKERERIREEERNEIRERQEIESTVGNNLTERPQLQDVPEMPTNNLEPVTDFNLPQENVIPGFEGMPIDRNLPEVRENTPPTENLMDVMDIIEGGKEKNQENNVEINLGRSAERNLGRLGKNATIQNITVKVDGKDIIGENNEPGLGQMNVVITEDGQVIVGDIIIPEEYRGRGIATKIYQEVSNKLGKPIVDSKTKGFDQTEAGGYIWRNRDSFQPEFQIPGLQIKSTMPGSPFEKQLSKTGEINVNNIKAHINKKDVSNQDKFILQKTLDENFAGQTKINYEDFKNAVSENLVALEKTINKKHALYGVGNIDYYRTNQEYERKKQSYQDDMSYYENELADLESQKKESQDRWNNMGFLQRTHLFNMGEHALNKVYYKIKKAQTANKIERLWNEYKKFRLGKEPLGDILLNETILYGNTNEFGAGRGGHFSEEPLGHSRVLVTRAEPNIVHFLETQSDWSQKGKKVDVERTKKIVEKENKQIETTKKYLEELKDAQAKGIEYEGYPVQDWQISQVENKLKNRLDNIEVLNNSLKNPDQKNFLFDFIQERMLQENMLYAVERGKTIMRYPTTETVKKIQGYSPDILDMKPELQTILNKYKNTPKMVKKTLGVDVKLVTDVKGNTWYEWSIPKDFLEGKRPIKAFKQGGYIEELDLTPEEIQQYVDGGYVVEELPKFRGPERSQVKTPKTKIIENKKPIKIPKQNYSQEYLNNIRNFIEASNRYQSEGLSTILPKVMAAADATKLEFEPKDVVFTKTGVERGFRGDFKIGNRIFNFDKIEALPEDLQRTAEQSQVTGELLRKFVDEYELDPYSVEGLNEAILNEMSEKNEGTIVLPFNEFYHGFKEHADFNFENLELDRSKIPLEKLKTSTTTGESSKWATTIPDTNTKHQYGLYGSWNLKSGRDHAFKYTPAWTYETGANQLLNKLRKTPEMEIGPKTRKTNIKNIQLEDGVKLLDVNYKDQDYNLKVKEIFRDILDIGKDNIGLPDFTAGISGELNLTEKAAKKLKEKYGYDGLIDTSWGELVITNKDVIKGVKDRDFKMYDYINPLDYYTATLRDQNSFVEETLEKIGGADYLIKQDNYYHPVLAKPPHPRRQITPEMKIMRYFHLPGSPGDSNESVKNLLSKFKKKYAYGVDSGFNPMHNRTKYLFDQEWYNKLHPSNLDLIKKRGGSAKRNKSKYSKSLLATNRLFAKNYLFKNPGKRKIYDPNAKHFKSGGSSNESIDPIEKGVDAPIYVNVNIRESDIHGKGLFNNTGDVIPKGTVIGVSHLRTKDGIKEAKTLSAYNHSYNPNIIEEDFGSFITIKALRDIGPDEELASNYDIEVEGLQDTSDFEDDIKEFQEGGFLLPKYRYRGEVKKEKKIIDKKLSPKQPKKPIQLELDFNAPIESNIPSISNQPNIENIISKEQINTTPTTSSDPNTIIIQGEKYNVPKDINKDITVPTEVILKIVDEFQETNPYIIKEKKAQEAPPDTKYVKQIKNLPNWNIYLNTPKLSYDQRKKFKSLLKQVEKQNGWVTEKQLIMLNQAKSGNFNYISNYGSKYQYGGNNELQYARRGGGRKKKRFSEYKPGAWADVKPELIPPGSETFDLPTSPSIPEEIKIHECPVFHIYDTILQQCVPMTEQQKADYGLKYMQDWANSPQHKIMLRNSLKKDYPNVSEKELESYVNNVTDLRKKVLNPKITFQGPDDYSIGSAKPLSFGSGSKYIIDSKGNKISDLNDPNMADPNLQAVEEGEYSINTIPNFQTNATFNTLGLPGNHAYVYPHEFSHLQKMGWDLIPLSDILKTKEYSGDVYRDIWEDNQSIRDAMKEEVLNSEKFKNSLTDFQKKYNMTDPHQAKQLAHEYIIGLNKFKDNNAGEDVKKTYLKTFVDSHKKEYNPKGKLANLYLANKDLYENNFDKFLVNTRVGKYLNTDNVDNSLPYDEFIKKYVKDEAYYKGYKNDMGSRYNYIATAPETISRLDAIRMYGKAAGIYDPFTEPLTKEKFNELIEFHKKQNPKTNDANQLQQLLDVYDEEEIFEMLNTISKNETREDENELQYAKYGGEFELGDEVDEATMERLRKLGYTFEEI